MNILKIGILMETRTNMTDDTSADLIALAADIVSAHISHNNVSAADLPGLITSVHAALAKTGKSAEPEPAALQPAVSVRSSIKQDYIVCLEDGKKLKMLKRYLRTNYDMTPEEYRSKWNLPRDYPMVAPAYADQRRSLATLIGLGRKKTVEAVEAVSETVPVPVKKAVKAVSAAAAKAQAHLGGPEDAPKPAAKRGRPAKPKAEAAPQATPGAAPEAPPEA